MQVYMMTCQSFSSRNTMGVTPLRIKGGAKVRQEHGPNGPRPPDCVEQCELLGRSRASLAPGLGEPRLEGQRWHHSMAKL
jgi:hypothetical protein